MSVRQCSCFVTSLAKFNPRHISKHTKKISYFRVCLAIGPITILYPIIIRPLLSNIISLISDRRDVDAIFGYGNANIRAELEGD